MEKKSANIWELEGGKATPPEGGNIALPPSKGEQEISGMTRDVI